MIVSFSVSSVNYLDPDLENKPKDFHGLSMVYNFINSIHLKYLNSATN